ncbi:hypothetical protein MMC29_007990 [Sticta canariensis]|nr:hypothetical protein [Sticta canariensis]
MEPNDDARAASSASQPLASDTPLPPLPAPPTPSADPGVAQAAESPTKDPGALPDAANIDIFTLTPEAAMKMLCCSIETLVRMTGDVPPTPPVSLPSTPIPRLTLSEKESSPYENRDNERPRSRQAMKNPGDIDSVPPKAKTPIGSPEAGPSEPFHVIGVNMEPLHIQHGAISRKFYSKKPPPISLEEYLARLHRYCPMSTAVYLATSLYIYRLAVIEKIIAVTARNVHRLLLAGLRVAMKALEDLSYPHHRFSKVGGISEQELGRLEVSFCFVTNFELKVDAEMLLNHAQTIREGIFLNTPPRRFHPVLPPLKDKANLSQRLPIREIAREAHAAA